MKTVLFAYRKVGYECIEHLIKIGEPPSLVVSPFENNNKIKIYKNIKNLCQENNIELIQVKKIINNIELKKIISSIRPDIFFSCYFPFIISSELLDIPKLGGLNLHGGILPYYRGTFSGVWSIINDEKKTGVTIHFMDEKVDLGDIVEIRECKIESQDTGFSLYEKTSLISIQLFKKYFDQLSNGIKIKRKKQSCKEGSYYKRELPYNGVINWNWSSRKIFNFCRALYFPGLKGAVFFFSKKEIEILEILQTTKKSNSNPGVFFKSNKKILVSSSTNNLEIVKARYKGAAFDLNKFIEFK